MPCSACAERKPARMASMFFEPLRLSINFENPAKHFFSGACLALLRFLVGPNAMIATRPSLSRYVCRCSIPRSSYLPWPAVTPTRLARPRSQQASSFSSSAGAATTAVTNSPLPKPKPYYITTPIFYVNANPHVGHLHSCVVADVLARYHNLRRKGLSPSAPRQDGLQDSTSKAVLCTGTDEHGLKIQKVAEGLGEDPKSLCDRISQRFKVSAAPLI